MIFPVPPPTPIPRPSVDQIKRREAEISQWERNHEVYVTALEEARAMKSVHWAVFSFCAALGLTALVLGSVPVVVLAVALCAGSGWRASRALPKPEAARPVPLAVTPFTDWENDYLLSKQKPQPFTAVCDCPGCGLEAPHSMAKSPVPWGQTARSCERCQRTWVQN